MEYQEKFDSYYEFIKSKNLIDIDINNIKEGDLIAIEFIPYSQKYLDILYPKIGTIININKNINEIEIKKTDGTIEYLMYPNCSYYGDLRGYDYLLRKIL